MKRIVAPLACIALIGAAPPPLGDQQVARMIGARPDGPGCAVALVDHGKVTFAKGYGLADVETKRPITPDTTFNIASMTKQFTAMAIALLIADGKLAEQDDIRRYLPELKDYGAPIRVAHLLNHSSGLRNHMALAAFQPGDHLPSHKQALALVFRQSALNFPPGTRHQYESPNYVLLAEIVSRVSGQSYEQFLTNRIFRPLGMTATAFASPALARAYAPAKNGGWALQEKVNAARGSSGLISNVRDFAAWMANYDQLGVGGKAALDRMLSISTLADGTPISYRYGLEKEFDYAGVTGLTRISHGGQTAAYRSAFSYFPGRGFGDVVMCNFTTDAQAIDQALVSNFVGGLKPPQPAHQGGSGTAAAMRAELPARLAGTYYSAADDDVRRFLVSEGGLALALFGQTIPLRWLGGQRFAIEDFGEFRFDGGSVTEVVEGQARLRFDRLPPAPQQDLAEFSGTYRSQDVDGPVTIAARGDKLTIRYPAGEAELTPVGRDHFSGQEFDFNSVRFRRAAGGKVDGLTLSVASGITRLRFARVAG
jgi:CubicO group peptidase (beta-lactamase class C family)